MGFTFDWIRASLLAVGSAVALGGCTVGPDFRGPPDVAPGSAHAATFVRASKAAVSNAPAVASWWESLNDPELTRLIEKGLGKSADIRAARARLRQARAGLRQEQRNELPAGSANAGYIDAHLGGGPPGIGSISLYNAAFDASWEIDLFGGTRRAIEAASAEAAAVQADLADTQVQLSAEIAQAYVDLRDRQQRLSLLRESDKLERQTLALIQQRHAQGVASELDVERTRTQVENTHAMLIVLDSQVAEVLDQLAVLAGEEPGALDAELSGTGPLPTLPEVVSVGDPAALLRQRPDIRAASWRLASSNARIGEKEAEWFPKLTLLGVLGLNASSPSGLLRGQNSVSVGAPLLQWNVLDFGRTAAGVEEAKAGFEEAEAKYETTVLGALRDANVALSRFGHERDHVLALRNAEEAATHAAQLAEQRFRAGTASALDWLDAERSRLSAEQDVASSRAALIKDHIALQKSLGLGWQSPNRS